MQQWDVVLQIYDEVLTEIVISLLVHSFDQVTAVLLWVVWHLQIALLHVFVEVPGYYFHNFVFPILCRYLCQVELLTRVVRSTRVGLGDFNHLLTTAKSSIKVLDSFAIDFFEHEVVVALLTRESLLWILSKVTKLYIPSSVNQNKLIKEDFGINLS